MCKTQLISQQVPVGEKLTQKDKEKELAKIQAKKHKRRDNYYQRTYGLTLEQYDQIKESQNNSCKICNKTDCKLVVDHCHTTDIIRGLLCHNCNVALGHLRDKPEVIGRCIEYLQDSREYLVGGIKVKYKTFSKEKIYKVQEI